MAAVVRQKEADGFEVVATYFDAHLDGDCALDLEGKPAPSTEGGAGAPAPAVLWQRHCKQTGTPGLSSRLLPLLRLRTAVHRGNAG